MIVRRLDGSGDWTWGDSLGDFLSDRNAVVQLINTRLKSFLGDCFFSLNSGVDWFFLLGSKSDINLELSIRATILNTEGVSLITSLKKNIDRRSRTINIEYSVSTIYDTTNINPVIQTGISF